MSKDQRLHNFRQIIQRRGTLLTLENVVGLMDEAYLTGHIRGKMDLAREIGTPEAKVKALKGEE